VKKQHTSTATSILTTKSTYRSLSAQRLSERQVLRRTDNWLKNVEEISMLEQRGDVKEVDFFPVKDRKKAKVHL
jgi:hypothetical protein